VDWDNSGLGTWCIHETEFSGTLNAGKSDSGRRGSRDIVNTGNGVLEKQGSLERDREGRTALIYLFRRVDPPKLALSD
jgi:hypothetical protein